MSQRYVADPSQLTADDVLSVSELTTKIKGVLEQGFQAVWVAGELSNVKRPQSGHVYMTLKDDSAQLSLVMWRGPAQRLRFELEDGLQVVAFGRITVYPPRGNYQMVVDRLMPRGLGALELAFRQLREKLQREGLFDPEHKQPLPSLPRTIGIVTSPTGAAVRDLLRVIQRRFPPAHIVLAPVKVQGDGAAEEICRAIERLHQVPGMEVIIVGRGGGSLEDLWAFNEERVVRAIFASRIPVVSAVGHEIDVTIADFVADVRAQTPSEAGELVVPVLAELQQRLADARQRLIRTLQRRAELGRARLTALAQSPALRRPLDRLHQAQQYCDDLSDRSTRALRALIALRRERCTRLDAQLSGLSPLNVLARGYSISLKSDGCTVIRRADQVVDGETVIARLGHGRLITKVTQREQT